MFGGGKIAFSYSSRPPPAQRPLQGHPSLAGHGRSQADSHHLPTVTKALRAAGVHWLLGFLWACERWAGPLTLWLCHCSGHCFRAGQALGQAWSGRAGCTVGLTTSLLKGEVAWFGKPLTTCFIPRGQRFRGCDPGTHDCLWASASSPWAVPLFAGIESETRVLTGVWRPAPPFTLGVWGIPVSAGPGEAAVRLPRCARTPASGGQWEAYG